MEAIELQNLWHNYNAKLERSLQLNMRLLEKIEGDKVRSSFGSAIRIKVISVVLGLLWNIFLGTLLYAHHTEPFFVISVGMIMIFTAIAIASCIYQIVLIQQLDLSGNIIETQRKLAVLHSSLIRSTRIQFLQAPFYCTFFITIGMIKNAGPLFWTIELVVTGAFVWASIWLFRNISTLNKDKRWVKMLIKGEGGASIAKAVQFIKEIDEFRVSGEWNSEDVKHEM
ncbi:MAG: hypothetical protein QM731_22190 [Chitinophagaceae bacterium]